MPDLTKYAQPERPATVRCPSCRYVAGVWPEHAYGCPESAAVRARELP